VLQAAASVRDAGYTVRVVDPCWVTPVDPEIIRLAGAAGLVVTIEDGLAVGGVGSRIAQARRAAGLDVPTREIGIDTAFLAHGKVSDVRAAAGMAVHDMGRRIVEWSALVHRSSEPDADMPAVGRSGTLDGGKRMGPGG
jgi:1-deoxy-D-xylulose-5-phosphate synthase